MSNEYIDLSLNFDSIGSKTKNVLTSGAELFLQEIELAIKMMPGEIWGITDSIGIDSYVFDRNVTGHDVNEDIIEYISRQCAHAALYPWTVQTTKQVIEGKPILHIKFECKVEENGISKDFWQKFVIGL